MEIRKYSTPINFVIFQLCWFACIIGAAKNLMWFGPLLVLAAVPLQIYLLTVHYKAETLFVLICGFCGFVLETLLIIAGVYTPAGAGSLKICPPWMAALWFNFGPLISISLTWLKGKYWLAAVLGGLAGPTAWWGGERLGALAVADSIMRGYAPLCLVWSLALPLMLFLHTWLIHRLKPALKNGASK